MAASVTMDIMEAIQTRLRALTYTSGPADANIVILTDPTIADREGTELPAILISPTRNESWGEGDNARDEVIYRYIIAIVDHHDGGLVADTTNMDNRLQWREAVRLGLQHWTPGTIATVWDSRLEPLQTIDRQWLPRNLWVSAMVLAVHSNEERTA